MRTVRRGVFETNSSSVHSLTIMTQENYDKWNEGTYMHEGEFYTFEEAKKALEAEKWFDVEESKEYTEEEWKETLLDYDYHTTETYYGSDYDTFEERFITPSGDKMIAFGFYGRDG